MSKSPLRRPGAPRPAAAGPRKAAPPKAAQPVEAPDAASQKLQKVLAQAGLGSRRAMEQWIQEGKVTVNGTVAGIGARVSTRDVIRIGKQLVRLSAPRRLPRVLIYHKPEGEIVSRDDPEGRASVFEQLPHVRGAKWTAVGRLDFNTGGLLIFTTSGELANRMMHPRFEVEREYAVRILGELKPDQMMKLKTGLELEDGVARFDSVEDEGGEGSNHWYRIILREGRKRVVRRMFEKLGYTVSRLMRVRFGTVALPPRLKRGQLAEMPGPEVKALLDWLDQNVPEPRPADPPA
jgi:23S rRNA pseudouridine2605 synthase